MGKGNREVLNELVRVSKGEILNLSKTIDDKEAYHIIEDCVLENLKGVDLSTYEDVINKVFAKIRCNLGILQLYIDRDDVNEIMVNGENNLFLETKTGEIKYVTDVFDSREELENVIRNIASGVNREINEMHPILDARLKDGSRVNAVYRNIAIDGPVLTIRKFSKEKIRLMDMIENRTITKECGDFLRLLVKCGYNIFVSGGTSSGKTTFLNALSDFIPSHERVIVIEDSTELNMSNIRNLVQMECHNANSMGQGEIDMASLIKTSLRMRPDRIVVGEVRGKEVSDMLQAMNTGHEGCLSTGHANSVRGMLRRLEAMYLMGNSIPIDAIRAQIVEGIDILVHLGRTDAGRRRVFEIQELIDFKDGNYVLNPLFVLDGELNLVRTDNELKNNSKLIMKGNSNGREL